MPRSDAVRVLMYSHDTFGLGHLTRTVRIARALRNRYEEISILILSGSPVAPYIALPPGADIVKMPSVVKAGKDRYRSRDLKVSFGQIRRIRREMIRGTAASYKPDLFMVDNVPLGMKKEILPTLEYLRASSPTTKIVLNLRDILDDPGVIQEAWDRDGVPGILEHYYDQIFVLGDPEIFDAVEAYHLPSEKTCHVGYAAPAPRRVDRPSRSVSSPRRVLFTVGGGGDGFTFLEKTLEGLEHLTSLQAGSNGSRDSIHCEIVTGPLMGGDERHKLMERRLPIGVELHEFVPDLPRRMARADLVVAMAGYNTCCEILSHANAALVWPRITPRVEQLMRAEAFERRGIATMLSPELKHPSRIGEAVQSALAGQPISKTDLPRMDGLDQLACRVSNLCPHLEDRGSSGSSLLSTERWTSGSRDLGIHTSSSFTGHGLWSSRYWGTGDLPLGTVMR